MSVPIRLGKTEIGTMFLLSLVFLAAVLAVLGVIFQDNWAKGGVGAAIIIAILLYWNITKERKTLTPYALKLPEPPIPSTSLAANSRTTAGLTKEILPE